MENLQPIHLGSSVEGVSWSAGDGITKIAVLAFSVDLFVRCKVRRNEEEMLSSETKQPEDMK
jgi:hypothetical protein